MYISPATRREEEPNPSGGMNSTAIAAVVVAVVVVLALALGFYLLRAYRQKHKDPKYIPTPFLKNAWRKWEPGTTHHRIPNSDHVEESQSVPPSLQPAQVSSIGNDATRTTARASNRPATTQDEIDRRTSVRSVMTLPAYNQNPLHNEQVLGREGERGGVDVVIEFPEGVDAEEESREAEMEALYQVRLARRRENEERDERRQLRRDARERGDNVALRELQARSRAPSNASSGPTVDEARAEHERIKKERLRAISSVSYAELGVARHDGTRLRANSNDSERDGLLAEAASMASTRHHRRDMSGGSVLSIDTVNTDLQPTRSRANSARSDRSYPPSSASPELGRSLSRDGRAGSSPEIIGADDLPLDSPPGYENVTLDTPTDTPHTEPPPVYSNTSLSTLERQSSSGSIASSRPAAVTVDSEGRRTSASHVGQLILERVPSNSSISSTPKLSRAPTGEIRSSLNERTSPHLQTFGLSSLPSIHVDPGSPASRNSGHYPGR